MTPVDRVRAWVEEKLPWFDVPENRRLHATARRVVEHADRVIEARTDDTRKGYRAYARRTQR